MTLPPRIRPFRGETTGPTKRVPAAFRAVFITLLLMCASQRLCAQSLEDEVRYEARDSIRYDLQEQTVYLFGAATVKYQGIQLTADRITFSFKNEEASAFGAPDSSGTEAGKPQFVQGGQTIEADSIRYNFRTKTGLIREVRTEEQTAWVSASLSKRHPNGEVHGKGGMLTTCDRPHPHYHFKVSRMMVVPDKQIVAGAAYMKVGKVPVPLALPFGLFPNQQGGSSGVLIPTWGNNQQLGIFLLNGGYYLPISDHADLQLTGDIYSRGSWAVRALTRYRTRYRYNGSLNLSHSTQVIGDPDLPDFSKQQNFFVRWNHLVDPKASLTDRFSASVNVGTSNNFTNNFNSSQNDFLSNTFQSNIQWTHLWTGKPYNLTVSMRHSQNTLNKTFDITLPSANFNLQRILPIQMLRPVGAQPRWYDQLAVNYTASFDNRLSTTEDRIYWANIPTLWDEMQNGVRQNANVSTTFKSRFFTLNPEFRTTELWYFETLNKTFDPETNTTLTDTVPGFRRVNEWNAGANLTSKLYGMYLFNGERLKAIRHTLTPTVGFTYRPDQSTEITGPFGPNGATSTYSPYDIGIYGKPAAGESGLLNLGLIQNLEAKVRDSKASRDSVRTQFKKMKLLDFVGINAAYDVMRDSVQWSPVNVSARTALFNVVNVNFVSLWDPYAVNEAGQRIDRSERSVSGKLARMTYTNVAVGFDLKSKRYGQSVDANNTGDQRVVEDSDPSKGARINFNMPWRLSVNYSYDINRIYQDNTSTDTERQSVLFTGDVTVLKHWKLGASSGYDLEAEEWTPTTLNLYWDLHCWEFNMNWIPFGIRQSISLRINVKASILRDLKVEQRVPVGGNRGLLF
jgi:hypothetical protein